MYTFESRIRYSETDSKQLLSLPGIIDYFQDCSTFHSEALGLGISYLTSIEKVWVLNSWQLTINRRPAVGEHILVDTWPYAFRSFFGYRNFRLREAKTGKILAAANSLWILLDIATKHPAKPTKEMLQGYELEERYPMEEASRKIKLSDNLTSRLPFPVLKNHLDSNGHVNNCQYIRMAMEYLPETVSAAGLRAEYRTAAHPGDTIYPYTSFADNKLIVNLADSSARPYALVEIQGCDLRQEEIPDTAIADRITIV